MSPDAPERIGIRGRIGWALGCRTGYPVKRWHRWRITNWLAERWDPVEWP